MIDIIMAEESHIPTVLEIEQEAFSPSWMEGSLLSQLDDEDAHFSVAVEDGTVVGFCVLHKAADEGELYQIAVREHTKRRGVGDLLLKETLEYCKKNGLVSVFLEVRKGNVPAVSLYKKHGFTVVGRRKNYYSSPVEDAIIMSLVFDTSDHEI